MKIFLSRRAQKALDDSSTNLRERLEEKISELLLTPYPKGCKKLKGAPNSYRIRTGKHRILYTIFKEKGEEEQVLIFKIEPRENAYE